MIKNQDETIRFYMHMAFLAGCGYGQAMLEQDMDNNFFDAFIGCLHAEKTAMPLHTVTGEAGESRPVRYCLRSDKWRKAMFESSKKELEKHTDALIKEVSA